MKKFVLVCLCFCLCFSFSGCKKKNNLSALSKNLTQYSINVDMDTTTYTASVYQKVDYVNNTGAIIKNVKFHLYPQFFEEGNTQKVVPPTHLNEAYPNGMSYAKFEVTRVRVAGKDVGVVYEGECDAILAVELNFSLMPEETVAIEIDFNFKLPNCYHRFGYGANTINLGNFYPIACVYENDAFNQTGYCPNGDPFFSDMANYNVTITTDKNFVVAGSGTKDRDVVENGKKVVTFSAIMVRDFAMVLSNKFQIKTAAAGSTQVEYYYFADENAESSLKTGVDALEVFNKHFGSYPYETFCVVQADFVYGGMEFPTLIMVSGSIANADDYKNVIVHETAHQWWYGMVGNNEFEFPWLDEALTDFSTMLFYDYAKGYNFAHAQMIEAGRQNYSMFVNVYTDVLGNLDTSMRAVDKYDTEPEYTYCTYVKGALMFESLYQLVGAKKFEKGLQTYFESCKYKNATPQDLIAAFEKACNTPLKNFFSSWVDGKVVVR